LHFNIFLHFYEPYLPSALEALDQVAQSNADNEGKGHDNFPPPRESLAAAGKTGHTSLRLRAG
jgi:hypothetical protein